MQELWSTISPILSAVILIGGAGAILYKWIAPALRGKEQIKKNTDEIEKIKRKQDNDLERFGRDEAYLQAICQMQLVMINHMIDGNHIEQMRETRDRITDLMVKM